MPCSSQAVLEYNGNLVIRNGRTLSDVLWQSFDYPTDTILPGGKIGYDYRTRESQQLTSWSGASDPSQGSYSVVLYPNNDQFVIQWNRNITYWSSGRWSGIFISNYIYNISYVKNENESYFTYDVYNASLVSRLVIDEAGQIKLMTWDVEYGQWFLFWSQPREKCSVYGYCGFFSVCDNGNCQCMDGFRPQSPKDSNISGYFSGNCVKENLLQCGRDDTFTRIVNMRSPRNHINLEVSSADECKVACLDRCPCTAYAYSSVCSIWTENLQVEVDEGPLDIYVRLAAPEQ